MKILVKLALAFFVVAFFAMTITGWISYSNAKETLQRESFNKLVAIREMKSEQLAEYFRIIKDQLIALSEDPFILEAVRSFRFGYNNIANELNSPGQLTQSAERINTYIDSAFIPYLDKNSVSMNPKSVFSRKPNSILLQDHFIATNPNDIGEKHRLDSVSVKCSYNKAHKKFHPVLRSFLERFGYYDIFLIDTTGDVIYTVFKETDFSSSLTNGPFSNSNLAECFRRAMRIKDRHEAALVDFSEYLPSYNSHASFMGAPIFENGKILGVIAFQLPIDNINNIMTNNKGWSDVGLGKTGETYIVGENFTLRNQSRLLIEDSTNYFRMLKNIGTPRATISKIRNYNSTVGLQEVKTLGTQEALKGIGNTLLFQNYRGVPVLSAFKPMKIFGMNWVIMSEIEAREAFISTEVLKMNIIKASIFLILFILLASFMVSRQITKPLKELEADAIELSKGNLDRKIEIQSKDEIGTLANSFRAMQTYLKEFIHGLEDKVKDRTAEVEEQNAIIRLKQQEHLDSLNYARQIQKAVLATDKFLSKYFPENFILFRARNIVSGDFYWASKNDTHFYLAVCDSTGHGVAGAFLSLLNMAFLNEAIAGKKITEPNRIFSHVREMMRKSLSKEIQQEGMEGVLLCKNITTGEITYGAAQYAPLIIRGKEVLECDTDKTHIGQETGSNEFRRFTPSLQKGDLLLIFTDGFINQFGGPKGKKMMHKTLHEKVKTISSLPVKEIGIELEKFFDEWRGENELVDDICMVGVRV